MICGCQRKEKRKRMEKRGWVRSWFPASQMMGEEEEVAKGGS
jgi:hypothetical protein